MSSHSPLGWRQCGKFLATVRRAGDAPAAFGRFGEQHPRALGLRRVTAVVRENCGHILHELLLTTPGECGRRRDDLNADGTRTRLSRSLDGSVPGHVEIA